VTVPELRPLLFSIAYRMLGSVAEAEDVVQEAFLRRTTTDTTPENERAFMIAVTTRIAIDVLRSARVRREAYVGSWLPEPLVEDDAPGTVERDETISLAFLVALERLRPDERAVLVLRDAFDYDFSEIGEIVGKEPANCRQILSRARRRVAEDRPRFDPDLDEGRALAERFLDAARDGDMDGLVALLAPDAVLVGDGGGKARSIPAPMAGAVQVGRALEAFYRLGEDAGVTLRAAIVNGGPGWLSFDPDGRLVNVVGLEFAGGVVTRVHSMLNPDKLGHLGPVSDLGLRPGQA
jgi:RNA polymerase sigma-70 factor, ECF subfamily